ncbi:MAG: lysophospholipid acyltransferase family protein [Candidatus Babeliaceae bacterium]
MNILIGIMQENKIIILLLTCLSYFLVFFILLFFLLPAFILVALLPAKKCPDNRLLFWFLDMAYRGIITVGFLPVKIHGEKIPNTPTIFVANHQSSLDIPLIGLLMHGYPHIWYVLESYARKPILNLFVKKNLGVSLSCESPTQAARGLIEGIRLIENKNRHIIIFPEGGRFTDGTVHEFFQGFAVIAKKTQRPVVPLYMPNNGKIYPPHRFLVHRFPFYVIIGPSYWYQSDDTDETFTQRIYKWFKEQEQQ